MLVFTGGRRFSVEKLTRQFGCRLARLEDLLFRPVVHTEIDTAHAGLGFLLDFSDNGGGSAGDELSLNAKALLETLFDLFSQLGATKNRNNRLAFSLRRFQCLVPFLLRSNLDQ